MALRIQIPSELKIISATSTQAVVEMQGLYPGYGITVGNALRRALLSSLPGAAITSFRVRGVQHEFSTLPGILEDIIELSLNLKRIRFRMFTDEPLELTLAVKGERKVSAADIAKHGEIEIVNPATPIATLTAKNAELDMVLRVEKGMGYWPVELRKKEKLPIGEIAVDAIFSPVERVNFDVENMRVGDRTDYNRLRLSVTTDGSVDPVSAVKEASTILVDHFTLFSGLAAPETTTAAPSKSAKTDKRKRTSKKPAK